MLAARRRWLAQAGAIVSTVALPFRIPIAAAQSQSTITALPRVALVIGNTKYIEAPLRNPGNDAKGIAGELQKLGFQVNLKLDAGRNEMIEAFRAFGAELGRKKGVGMFYYAGHGVQLAWKNYLIPVDALIDKVEDLQTKTVELNSLLEGLIKAQNPMNVIILDACRDNRKFKPPFSPCVTIWPGRETVNRAVFGENSPLSMTICTLHPPELPHTDAV